MDIHTIFSIEDSQCKHLACTVDGGAAGKVFAAQTSGVVYWYRHNGAFTVLIEVRDHVASAAQAAELKAAQAAQAEAAKAAEAAAEAAAEVKAAEAEVKAAQAKLVIAQEYEAAKAKAEAAGVFEKPAPVEPAPVKAVKKAD